MMVALQRTGFILLILAISSVCQVESLSCSQCATSPRTPATLSECTLSPPSPTPCPQTASYCLILKEYNPSLSDDADAAMADSAGSLHFLARTCVGENVGDTCSTGNKSSTGKIVTVCRSHCEEDGCNHGQALSPVLTVLTVSLGWSLLRLS